VSQTFGWTGPLFDETHLRAERAEAKAEFATEMIDKLIEQIGVSNTIEMSCSFDLTTENASAWKDAEIAELRLDLKREREMIESSVSLARRAGQREVIDDLRKLTVQQIRDKYGL
jgi:hypothetical protein